MLALVKSTNRSTYVIHTKKPISRDREALKCTLFCLFSCASFSGGISFALIALNFSVMSSMPENWHCRQSLAPEWAFHSLDIIDAGFEFEKALEAQIYVLSKYIQTSPERLNAGAPASKFQRLGTASTQARRTLIITFFFFRALGPPVYMSCRNPRFSTREREREFL